MAAARLDERLQTAAELFPACAYGADIGADHGRLSCYLLETGVCQRMCVTDISGESLKKARDLLALKGLSARADLRVGDGLTALAAPAGAVAILGMGARTMRDILLGGRDRLQGAALILSAHTEPHLIRRALEEMGYRITRERVALAAGRYYVILRAEPGEERLSEKQCRLGPRLMETREPRYPGYLLWQKQMTLPKRTREAKEYLQWLEEEMRRVGDGGND